VNINDNCGWPDIVINGDVVVINNNNVYYMKIHCLNHEHAQYSVMVIGQSMANLLINTFWLLNKNQILDKTGY
jgi:hypothetical protein